MYLSYSRRDDAHIKPEADNLASKTRTNMHILLNHMQVLEMRRDQFRPAIEALHASIIFSAHTHVVCT